MVTTRFLDNVIDLFDYPVEEVQSMSRNTRRLGLGVMGFADMLYELGVRYDSQAGFATGEHVMRIIAESSHKTSIQLAVEKGEFPHWKDSTWSAQNVKRRNTMVTTVAPTGSISMFFDTSSGIEPQFALSYTKQDKDGHTYKYINRYLEQALKARGIYTEDLMQKIVLEGSLVNIEGIPQEVKDTFRVAMDIAAPDHIRMQAAFQKYVENSISKTINFPNEATIKDIENGYIMAWQLGCKGCTLYRDGSREVQVLNLNKNLDKAKSLAPGMEHVSLSAAQGGQANEVKPAVPTEKIAEVAEKVLTGTILNGFKKTVRERPEVMTGMTYRLRTPYGNLFVTVNEDEHGPFEVFSNLGKAGGFFQAQTEAICRLASLAFRSGIPTAEVIDQLKGIRGPDVVFSNGGTIHSLPDAIARVLEQHIKRGQKELDLKLKTELPQPLFVKEGSNPSSFSKEEDGRSSSPTSMANLGHAPACPDCGNMLIMGEGCLKCDLCGFSKCG